MSGWLPIKVEGNESQGYLDSYRELVEGCDVNNNDQSYGLVFINCFYYVSVVYCKSVFVGVYGIFEEQGHGFGLLQIS